jgi:hypothetical protein
MRDLSVGGENALSAHLVLLLHTVPKLLKIRASPWTISESMFLKTMFTFKTSPGFFIPSYRRPYYGHATKLLAQNIQEVEINDIDTVKQDFFYKIFRFKHFL